MSEETWIQTAERITLFKNQGRGAEAARLLEISPTNRVLIDRTQAIILLIGRLQARRMTKIYPDNKVKWDFQTQILDDVEEHQLTMNGLSREQFMKMGIAQCQGEKNRAKNEMENLVK